jgi:hypothetical protein
MSEDTKKAEAPASTLNIDLTDIQPVFHAVVLKYGRDLFQLAIAVQMGQQGVLALLNQPAVQNSQEARVAVQILTEQFNLIAGKYLGVMGWTLEQLQDCSKACELAYASRIVVPAEGIILKH